MPTPNNAILWNASLEGYLAGQLANRRITAVNTGTPPAIGTPDPSYAALAAEGTQWATAMDTATLNDNAGTPVPADTIPISFVTTGVAIVPSTDATGDTEFAQVVKARTMAGCALAVFESRYYAGSATALTEIEFTALTETVEAMYLEGVDLVTSGRPLGSGHSFLVQHAVFAGGLGAIFGETQSFTDDSTFIVAIGYVSALGQAVDLLIANGVTVGDGAVAINQGSGYPVAPTTGVKQDAVLGAFRLLFSITLAYLETRPTGQLFAQGNFSNIAFIEAWGVSNAPPIAAVFAAAQSGLCTGGSAPLNPLLYNEAYCAFIASNLAGRPFTSASSTDPNYVAVAAAATAFASAVDAAVGTSDNSATPAPPGSAPINLEAVTAIPSVGQTQEAQLGKTGLMWAICRGTMRGRPLLGNALDATVSTYSTVASSIVALYLEMASVCLNTPA
jgi:hypothetical protein